MDLIQVQLMSSWYVDSTFEKSTHEMSEDTRVKEEETVPAWCLC